jgi:hypothetical protein
MVKRHTISLLTSVTLMVAGGGCASHPRPTPYVRLRECLEPLLMFSGCLGLSLQEATTRMGLDQGILEVIEEPPSVARGVAAWLGPSEAVELFVDRHDPVCERLPDPFVRATPKDIATATVVGVRYRNRTAGFIDVGDIPVGVQIPEPDYELLLTGPDVK